MYRLVALVAVVGTAHASTKRERSDMAPCTCIARHVLDYEVLPDHKLTLFESQTITNLDHAYNSHFANCMHEYGAIDFTLELTFKANHSVPQVRAKGPAPLVKCIETERWTYFGSTDRDTTVRFRISDHYGAEQARREAARTQNR